MQNKKSSPSSLAAARTPETGTQIQHLHGKPINRREALARGFATYGATLVMPSALSMISGRAYGADPVCSAPKSATTNVPFLIFDLAGGANIAGTNVIVGDRGGQASYLKSGSYASLGLTAAKEPSANAANVDTTFGLAFHADSKMLAGMKQFATTAAPGVDGALFCAASGDDTSTNPHSPLYWIAKAGLSGSLVSLIGSTAGIAGGNSVAPTASVDASKRPTRISKPADSLGLVDPGKLATLLGSATAADGDSVKKVMAAIKTMSESRLRQFQAKDVPSQIQELIQCGYINSAEYLSAFTPAALDPRQNAQVTALYTNMATDVRQQAAGTIAHLVLEGYAGAGVVSLGGFDYHALGRPTQDAQDLLAGQMIGRALELAAQKQKPLMIYVYTDGGVAATGGAATNGIFAFSSDSGQRSAAFTLVYRPGGERPPMRNNVRQIGAYTPNGAVDESAAAIGNNVTNLSKAITANWLALHGKEGELAKATGDNPFGGELEKYLAFTKIV